MEDIGYIYCLSNPNYANTYKIGFTNQTPQIRKKQLETTGVLAPLRLNIIKKLWIIKIKKKLFTNY
jgi:hypothetical protein